MPTKPTDNVPEWASNANFAVGPSGIVGTPTRNATSLAGAVANGFVPWLPESPATGQHTNEWMHRGWALLDWVYQGTSGPSADAHIVETDSDGRTEWTAAPGGMGVATIEATVTGSGGTAIQGSAVNGVSIRASNDSATLAALVATNADATAGAVSCLASAIGAGDGVRTDVFDSARGFVAALDAGSLAAARGFFCDVGAVEGTAIEVRTGNNSGTGIRIEGISGGGYGLDCQAISAIGTLARFSHLSTGTALRVETPMGSGVCLSADGSGSSNTSGTVQIIGNGAAGPAIWAGHGIQASSSAEQLQRAVIYSDAGDGGLGRGTAIAGVASDAFATSGIGVNGISAGLSAESAGVRGDATLGTGHGVIAAASLQRAPLRLVPGSGAYPANGALGDLAVLNSVVAALDGLAIHDGLGWRRVAHTAYRYREPAIGHTISGSVTGSATSAILAPATFTAADGGDVLIEVSLRLSQSVGGVCAISVESDDGAGLAVTTHLSLMPHRIINGTGAATESQNVFVWARKVTPINTGARRYYVTINQAGGGTVTYYWGVSVKVSGELTP